MFFIGILSIILGVALIIDKFKRLNDIKTEEETFIILGVFSIVIGIFSLLHVFIYR